MKKLFVSVGLAAAGAATVNAYASAPSISDSSKIWTLSGTLRGFYDDNYAGTPHKVGSGGVEFSPTFNLHAPLQQTEIGLQYTYGLYWYEKRSSNAQNSIDQTHQLDLYVDHAFSPNWDGKFTDTFVVTRDPFLNGTGTATPTPQRIDQNSIANYGTFDLHTDWSRQFSTDLTYGNSYYDYNQSGQGPTTPATLPNVSLIPPPLHFVVGTGNPLTPTPSYSGLLDRDENLISLAFQWHVSPVTTAQIGGKYGQVIYLANEIVGYNDPFPYTTANPMPYYSKSRDSRSYYGFVGVQHEFLENLVGSANIGAQYTDYYNDSGAGNSLGPYADASLIYTYMSGSYIQVGLSQTRNATDAIRIDSSGKITQDQESTVVYGSINHSITPKLMASVVGNFQYSTYNGGAVNNQTAELYDLGLNLTYSFNRYFSMDVGYNFDWYTTAKVLHEDYTRNRVYLGVTATY